MDYYTVFLKYRQVFKYLIVGGFVVSVNLSVLYILTDIFHVHYLISAICSFLVSFCVSFFLQGSWTFENKISSGQQVARQMSLYLALQAVCLGLNTSLLYVFVEYMNIWYLFSQAIISLFIAIFAFIISRRFIFNQ